MKRIFFTLVICAFASTVFAQADSSKVKTDTATKANARIAFSKDGATFNTKYKRDTSRHASQAPGFSWAITFSRFDLGLTTMIDNGSTTLSPQNQFLRYRSWKSSNVGFDVLDFKYRFTSSFRIYLAAGFDWTLFRLRDNITIQKNGSQLSYVQDNIDFSKNRFSASYLRIPLSFEFRTKDNSNGNNWHFVFGPEGGVLLGAMVKQISDENGKQKMYNNYHFTRFRYGPFIRVGQGGFGIFAKYYMNDMFEDSAPQKGLKNFAFGFTLGF